MLIRYTYQKFIMGDCWSVSKDDRGSVLSPQILSRVVPLSQLILDTKSQLLQSYNQDQSIFQKKQYDWCSIPFVNDLKIGQTTSFTVCNRKITDDNFLVGVIKRDAIISETPTPWKTSSCICYESHKSDGESNLIYENQKKGKGASIGQNEQIQVIFSKEQIQFRKKDRKLVSMKIPQGFLNDKILPYVAVFNEGDKIEIVRAKICHQNDEK